MINARENIIVSVGLKKSQNYAFNVCDKEIQKNMLGVRFPLRHQK